LTTNHQKLKREIYEDNRTLSPIVLLHMRKR
jgi:hypothetical protein